jgi:hypothetical protein
MIKYKAGQHLKCTVAHDVSNVMIVGKVYAISYISDKVIHLYDVPPNYGWSDHLVKDYFELVDCPCAIKNCIKHRKTS